MKKFYAILCLAIASLTQLQAQAPQGFNYQATVRNSVGDLIVNTNVYFKFNVIQGSQTAVPIFTETHYVPTDDLGQVNLVIGQGTANTGVFSEIDWSSGSYYLGIELDTGNGYVAMGTTQLLSVPYALYAANSGNSTPTTPNLETVLAENNSANNQQIKDLQDPTQAQDAVTKAYIDALIANLQSQIDELDTDNSSGLTGTWRLAPESGALGVGPAQDDVSWWSNTTDDVATRSCLFDDEYVFGADGSFQNIQGDQTWVEAWQGAAGEECGAPVAPHDGSAAATYTYDEAAGTITINGAGAYLVLSKVINGAEIASPADAADSITYIAALSDDGNSLELDIEVAGGGHWSFKLVKDVVPVGVEGTGTVTDIDGNSYDYLTYGDHVWTVENAEMVTYRDGTPIPQVPDRTAWASLTTGAWCYYNNDPTKPRLYNWYAVMGIHDTDPNTPNKEFAPEGWHVPTDAEWTTLENYLIANDYNYDGTITGNKIAKAMASITGWNSSTDPGAVGNDQSLNNDSGFNAVPEGFRFAFTDGSFNQEGISAFFWSSTENGFNLAWDRYLDKNRTDLVRNYSEKRDGASVRFVRD